MARPLTKHEKILGRHHLQVLIEQARPVRDALDPNYGRLSITDEVWAAQWEALKHDLDAYTADVIAGRGPSGIWPANDKRE